MNLVDRFYEDEKTYSKDERILFGILSDLTSRSGFDSMWHSLDDDIHEEILREWLRIIEDETT